MISPHIFLRGNTYIVLLYMQPTINSSCNHNIYIFHLIQYNMHKTTITQVNNARARTRTKTRIVLSLLLIPWIMYTIIIILHTLPCELGAIKNYRCFFPLHFKLKTCFKLCTHTDSFL